MNREPPALWNGPPEIRNAPLPPLEPYQRCRCGTCRTCLDNAKWDRIFAKFEVKDDGEVRGLFQSPLNDLG